MVVEVNAPYDNDLHERTLPQGLFVDARIPGLPVASAVGLPSSALQSDESVFVLVDNGLLRRQVKVAHRGGDTVVISGGLESGDRVVTTRLEVMFQGMKPEPVDA